MHSTDMDILKHYNIKDIDTELFFTKIAAIDCTNGNIKIISDPLLDGSDHDDNSNYEN